MMYIIVLFSLVGAIDKICGSRYGYGQKFDEAFEMLKSLALIMIGSIPLAPVLNVVLSPVIKPIYTFFGASPAMFAGTLFAIDSGAYPLAMELAGEHTALGNFSGIILGATFGSLLLGVIPISMGMLEKKYHRIFALSLIFAIITQPIGCIAGGMMMNLTICKISLSQILINLIPVILVAVLLIISLLLIPQTIMSFFCKMGDVIQALMVISLVLSGTQYFTGVRFPLFHLMVDEPAGGGMSPFIEALVITGTIMMFLLGALPMTLWISRVLKKPITYFSNKAGIDENGSAAMVASFTSYFPVLAMIKDMDEKSQGMVLAYAISGSFVIGDHFAYTASVCPRMILPMMVAKLTAGIGAFVLMRVRLKK